MAYLPIERQQEIDSTIDNIRLKIGLSYPKDGLVQIAEALGVKVYGMDFDEYIRVNEIIRYKDEDDDGPVLREEAWTFLNRTGRRGPTAAVSFHRAGPEDRRGLKRFFHYGFLERGDREVVKREDV